MAQTRLTSLQEASLNTLSGFLISFIVSMIAMPLFGLPVSIGQNLGLTMIFTVTSILRSYFWRRWFNKKESVKACQCASK